LTAVWNPKGAVRLPVLARKLDNTAPPPAVNPTAATTVAAFAVLLTRGLLARIMLRVGPTCQRPKARLERNEAAPEGGA
jgi:hypothetical protein